MGGVVWDGGVGRVRRVGRVQQMQKEMYTLDVTLHNGCAKPMNVNRRVRVSVRTPLSFGWVRNYHTYLFTLGLWAYPDGKKLPMEHDISFGPVCPSVSTEELQELMPGASSKQIHELSSQRLVGLLI